MRQRRPFGEAPSGSLAVDELCCDINDFVRRCPAVWSRTRARRARFPGRRVVDPISQRQTYGTFTRRASYAYQLDAFAAAVLRGEPVKTPPADSVENMTVIDAIYRAAGLPLREPS